MDQNQLLTSIFVPGHNEDDRIWGNMLTPLRERSNVVLLPDLPDLSKGDDVVLLTSSDAASEAVHAAREGKARALVLLMPTLAELLPDTGLDYVSLAHEKAQDWSWLQDVVTISDPEERRTSLADGMVGMMGPELPAVDAARLHSMFRDMADTILTRPRAADRPRPYADALKTLDVPVLFIGAGRDEAAMAIIRALFRRTPYGELVLLDTPLTFYPWLAKPDQTAAAVLDFLTRIQDGP